LEKPSRFQHRNNLLMQSESTRHFPARFRDLPIFISPMEECCSKPAKKMKPSGSFAANCNAIRKTLTRCLKLLQWITNKTQLTGLLMPRKRCNSPPRCHSHITCLECSGFKLAIRLERYRSWRLSVRRSQNSPPFITASVTPMRARGKKRKPRGPVQNLLV